MFPTHICLVDESGAIVWRGVCATDPRALADVLSRHCPDVVRVVLETGALSAFLYHGLVERGLPVVCICARHAKGVLSTRVNKSDPHDAEGLAQLARTGWFKAVHIKGDDLVPGTKEVSSVPGTACSRYQAPLVPHTHLPG